jgi:type I restriction enzyme S subunit
LLPSDTFSYTKFATCILFFTKGSKTEKVEFRDLSFNEINIDGQKTKVIKEDKLLGIIDIKTIKEKNYSLKPDDYFKEEVVVLEEDKDKWIKLGDIIIKNNAGEVIDKLYFNKGNNNLYSCSNTVIKTDYDKFPLNKLTEDKDLLLPRNGSQIPYVKIPIINSLYTNVVSRIKINSNYNYKYIYYYLNLTVNKFIINESNSIPSYNLNKWFDRKIPNLLIEHQEEIVKFLDEQFENYNINNLKKDIPIFKLLIAKQYEMAAELLYMVYRQMAAEQEVENIKKVMKAVFDFNIYNLKDCETKKLGDLCKVNFGTRITKSKDEVNKYSTDAYPVYGGGDITFYTNKHNRDGETIIISRFGVSPKCVRVIKDKFFLNDSGMSIHNKNNNFNINYLKYYLLFNQNNIYKNYTAGQAQLNTETNKLLNKFMIPIPSLEKQQEIVNKIEKFENYKLEYIEHANMIKQELDNYIQNINDNKINENIINNNLELDDNESEVEIEDSEE